MTLSITNGRSAPRRVYLLVNPMSGHVDVFATKKAANDERSKFGLPDLVVVGPYVLEQS